MDFDLITILYVFGRAIIYLVWGAGGMLNKTFSSIGDVSLSRSGTVSSMGEEVLLREKDVGIHDHVDPIKPVLKRKPIRFVFLP